MVHELLIVPSPQCQWVAHRSWEQLLITLRSSTWPGHWYLRQLASNDRTLLSDFTIFFPLEVCHFHPSARNKVFVHWHLTLRYNISVQLKAIYHFNGDESKHFSEALEQQQSFGWNPRYSKGLSLCMSLGVCAEARVEEKDFILHGEGDMHFKLWSKCCMWISKRTHFYTIPCIVVTFIGMDLSSVRGSDLLTCNPPPRQSCISLA